MVLRVELAQIEVKVGRVEENLKKHLEILETTSADCVVFPELSLTGYILKDLIYETFKEVEEAVSRVAETSRCAVLGGIKEISPGILRNSAAVILNGQVNFVPKFYLPTYGLFEERRYFQRGNPLRDLRVFDFNGFKFGVLICEDAWHPEPVEALARLGAEAVFIPSASPMRRLGKSLGIEDQWTSLIKAHSLMNGVWIVFSNLVGPQDEEFFWGGSMVSSPLGEIRAKGKIMEEDRVVAEIDVEDVRRSRFFSSYRDHVREFHQLLSELD